MSDAMQLPPPMPAAPATGVPATPPAAGTSPAQPPMTIQANSRSGHRVVMSDEARTSTPAERQRPVAVVTTTNAAGTPTLKIEYEGPGGGGSWYAVIPAIKYQHAATQGDVQVARRAVIGSTPPGQLTDMQRAMLQEIDAVGASAPPGPPTPPPAPPASSDDQVTARQFKDHEAAATAPSITFRDVPRP